jgi:general secretion pathway protein D
MGVFGPAIEVGGISFPNIGAMVQAYKKDDDIHILSNPQILTTDNEEAKIVVGKNIPYQTRSAADSGTETYSSYEYRDVGQQLQITPQIGKDGSVRLLISLEITAVESAANDRPTTLKRTVDTTVLVQNENTVVIGGLIDKTVSFTDYRTPCLGDIPGLGWLFRSAGRRNEKTNLYIFITPRVIQNAVDADKLYRLKKDQIETIQETSIKMYNRTRQGALDELAGKPIVKESWLPDNPPLESPESGQAPSDDHPVEGPRPPAPTTAVEPSGEQPASGQTESETNAPDNSVVSSESQEVSAGPAEAEPQKGYTIQVAAVRDFAAAQQMVAQLQEQGFQAYSITQPDGQGKPWYRIRVGSFPSANEARAVYQELSAIHYTPIIMKY